MNSSKLKKMIIELTGSDPVDMFGEDWEQYAEELLEEAWPQEEWGN